MVVGDVKEGREERQLEIAFPHTAFAEFENFFVISADEACDGGSLLYSQPDWLDRFCS